MTHLTLCTPEAAHGRWREILPLLGLPVRILDGKSQPCPSCGGKDRFTFDDRSGNGDFVCRQCGAGKGIQLVARANGWSYAEAAKRVDEVIGNLPKDAPPKREPKKIDRSAMLNRLWKEGRPIENNSPAGRYLEMRGGLSRSEHDLRYVPAMLDTNSNAKYPGLVAMVRDVNGKAVTLHRTFLSPDGNKAKINPCRKLMPGGFPHGAAVRLGGMAETIGIAEGIETALAASIIFGVPVWAALNEVGLQHWQPPAGIKRILICGDNDRNFVGQSAAYLLGRKLSTDDLKHRGLEVEVKIPDRIGADWNDELLREREDQYARVA